MSPKLIPTVLSPYPSPINSRSQSPLPPRQDSIENSGNESAWNFNQPGAGGLDASSSLYAPPRPLRDVNRKDGPLVISVADFSPSSNTSTTTSFCADPELAVDWRTHQSSNSSSRSHSSASSSRSRSRAEDRGSSSSPSMSTVSLEAADIPSWREVVSVAWADLKSEMGTLPDLACELHRNLYSHTNLADTVHERSMKLVEMINEGVTAIESANPDVGLSTCGQKYKKLWHGSRGIRIPRTVDALVSLNRTFVQSGQKTQPPTPAARAETRFPPLPEATATDEISSPIAEAKVLDPPTAMSMSEAWKCFFLWLAHGAKI